jgi:hypothetical protein
MVNEENKKETIDVFSSWVQSLDANALNLWREAMAQIRQLHGDVWNGVRFFLTVNGIIVAAILAIFRLNWSLATGIIIAVMASIGLFLTLIAKSILGKHREYYLGMLLRKTLLEKELGFYDMRLHGVDLSFPWNVDRRYVPEMIEKPDKWTNEQKFRKGTISRLLWLTYWVFVVLYVVFLMAVAIGGICRVFFPCS